MTRQIHPNSRMRDIGRSHDRDKNGKGVGRVTRTKVAPYPCPRCLKSMWSDEELSFGTIDVAGGKATGRHHKTCEEPK